MEQTKQITNEVYLDNSATTYTDERVIAAMLPFYTKNYGNPGSMHNKGIEAKSALMDARKDVAAVLNCDPKEIIFTGSGTESDNLAIFGYVRKNKKKGNHIITTEIEHPAVKECFLKLEKEGFSMTFLGVDKDGLVDPEKLREAIQDDTIFVSVIYGNNEIGTIQDIKKLSKICKEKNIVFHTDACQVASSCTLDVKELGVDLLTLNGSKLYGPKGVGILFKKRTIDIEPVIVGGGQENGLRSGTENIPEIVGFTKALQLTVENREQESERLCKLRDYLISELLKIPETKLNGHPEKRLANNVNISFLNVEGESVLLLLNEEGIYASTGSACSSKSLDPSYVIVALGLPHEVAHASIRFSLGRQTTKEDIDKVLEKLPPIIQPLRKISPLRQKMSEVVKNE